MTNSLDLSGGLPVEREHMYESCPERDGTRDAVNVWIEEDDAAFAMRIGVEAAAPKWDAHDIWLDIAFPDGRVLSLRGEGPAHDPTGPEGKPTILGAGPLSFRCVEPFRTWRAHFEGQAQEIGTQALIDDPRSDFAEAPMRDVAFDIEMTMAVPPYVPGSMSTDAAARLKDGAEGDFMSPRYEQLFRAKGTLRIGSESRDFSGKGLRVRRQGYRKFEGFSGHCWQSALFPSGRAFAYCIYPPDADGKPGYAEGYIYDGTGAPKPARILEAPWLTRLTTGGDKVPCLLETDDGRVAIDGVSFVNTRSRGSTILPANFPIVQQAHVRYNWGGEETVGMMERSSTPDKFVA
jgi:hypothetical protein